MDADGESSAASRRGLCTGRELELLRDYVMPVPSAFTVRLTNSSFGNGERMTEDVVTSS